MKPAANGAALLRLLDPDHIAGDLAAQVLAQDLRGSHARQLLALLHRLRAAQSNAWHYGGITEQQAAQLYGTAIAAVKQELATRPHIPNKAEARALRQAAARRR